MHWTLHVCQFLTFIGEHVSFTKVLIPEISYDLNEGRRGRDRMVVGFTLFMQSVHITTKVVSLNPVNGEVHLIQHYVIKFVSDFRQVRSFLRVLRFPPPIKMTSAI